MKMTGMRASILRIRSKQSNPDPSGRCKSSNTTSGGSVLTCLSPAATRRFTEHGSSAEWSSPAKTVHRPGSSRHPGSGGPCQNQACQALPPGSSGIDTGSTNSRRPPKRRKTGSTTRNAGVTSGCPKWPESRPIARLHTVAPANHRKANTERASVTVAAEIGNRRRMA